MILDACRDNPFGRTMKRTLASRGIGRGLAQVEPTSSNTLIAYSAKAGFTAQDGDGANSPFTIALSKHLTTPGLDVRRAFGFVRDASVGSLPGSASGWFLCEPRQASARQDPGRAGSCGRNREGEAGRG
ncbi:putative caspase-like protein [Bradyrhizobium sp. GM24.11]